MVYGSGLTHALDYVVLLHLLFMLEEDRPVTVKDLWEALQAEGVRSAKNARELVGRDAVYESVKRLIEARFVHRVEEGGVPGRFGQVRYLVYRQPSYHPDFGQPRDPGAGQEDPDVSKENSQVAPLPGTPEVVTPRSPKEGKIAGRTASRNAGYGNAGYGVTGSGTPRIPAGRTASGVPGSGGVSPPHPPGGGGTSSPYPLHVEACVGGGGRGEGEDAAQQQDNPARLLAAADFLQDLPRPWRVGRKTAQELAPLLLEAAADQGWQLGPELVRELTQNPGGVRSYPRTLKVRIEDLPRASGSTSRGAGPNPGVERCPYHPARELVSCPCQRADNEPQPHPASDDAREDPAAVRAAAQRALAALRGRATDSGSGGTSSRPPRSRAARDAAAREGEAERRAAANALLGEATDVDSVSLKGGR